MEGTREKILNLAWTVLHLRPLLILAFANLEQSTSFHNFKVGDWEVFLKWKPRPSPTGYGYGRRPPGVGLARIKKRARAGLERSSTCLYCKRVKKRGIGIKIFPSQIEECFFVIFLTFNEKILSVEPRISILHEPYDS